MSCIGSHNNLIQLVSINNFIMHRQKQIWLQLVEFGDSCHRHRTISGQECNLNSLRGVDNTRRFRWHGISRYTSGLSAATTTSVPVESHLEKSSTLIVPIESNSAVKRQRRHSHAHDECARKNCQCTQNGRQTDFRTENRTSDQPTLNRLIRFVSIFASKDGQFWIVVTEEFQSTQFITTPIAKIGFTSSTMHVVTAWWSLNEYLRIWDIIFKGLYQKLDHQLTYATHWTLLCVNLTLTDSPSPRL